jgi:hypothetical protein
LAVPKGPPVLAVSRVQQVRLGRKERQAHKVPLELPIRPFAQGMAGSATTRCCVLPASGSWAAAGSLSTRRAICGTALQATRPALP